MKNQYFLDESGNTGDLVKLPSDLNFANQPFFSLSCVGVEDCDDLTNYVDVLKKKYGVQGDELKSKNLYKSKPNFIFELFEYIEKKKLLFYVEVVDKKYCIATSIVNHQIVPPYFEIFESAEQTHGFTNELADYLTEYLPLDCYEAFFESCISKSEASLLKSMEKLKNYFTSSEFKFQYKKEALHCLQDTIKYYHNEKPSTPDLVKNFIPIPDISKNGSDIHLLPHVHSWSNIMAKVNKFHNSDISEVTFFHDQQDHFDDILMYCSEQMKGSSAVNPFDPTTDFNIKGDISLEFPDSKKISGIQLADVLAGFISRYVMGFAYSEDAIDETYHNIFMRLVELNHSGINFVLPISRRNKLFKKINS